MERRGKLFCLLNKEAQQKNLSEDVVVVMRVLETALTLNDVATYSQDTLEKENAQISNLQGHSKRLKNDIINHEVKYEVQVQLLKDLNELRPQLEAVTKENERLDAWIKELEETVAHNDEETNTEKALEIRKDLIDRNCVLEQDVVDTLNYGFNTAMEQLKIINSGVKLVIEGVVPFNQVVFGKIIYLSNDHSEE